MRLVTILAISAAAVSVTARDPPKVPKYIGPCTTEEQCDNVCEGSKYHEIQTIYGVRYQCDLGSGLIDKKNCGDTDHVTTKGADICRKAKGVSCLNGCLLAAKYSEAYDAACKAAGRQLTTTNKQVELKEAFYNCANDFY